MKKLRRMVLLTALSMCLVFASACIASGTKAEAAAKAFTNVFGTFGTEQTVKVGAYYFQKQGTNVYVSKSSSSGFQRTPVPSNNAYTDGSIVYYMINNKLYQYSLSAKKETTLKTLHPTGDAYFSISGVSGNKIFITKGSFNQWKLWTYVYNTSRKTFTKVMDNCDIESISGNYAVGRNDYRTDVGPYSLTVYKITSTGLKKVKKLTNYGRTAEYIGGKLYFSKYEKGTMKKVTLCRASKNGSGVKKIAVIKSGRKYGSVIIMKKTSTYCNVWKDSKNYKYVYKTKKMTRI